jgi:hypothetical protein
MPTLQQQAIDIQRVVALKSGTSYVGWFAALAAAVALSAANANAVVQIARVEEVVTAPTGVGPGQLAQVNLPGGGTPYYIVQLSTSTTYYPLESARVAAYALSAANSNAPVYIAKVIETVTAP